MRRYRLLGLLMAGCGVLLAASPGHAQVQYLQNDSFTGGAYTCVLGFGPDEGLAAKFTAAPAAYPYDIHSVRVLGCGGLDGGYVLEIYQDNGGTVNPGPLIYQGTAYIIDGSGSAFSDIILTGENVPLITSGSVRVVLTDILAAPIGFGRDQNGIQAHRNYIREATGTWHFAEDLGVTGDFILRLGIIPAGSLPSLSINDVTVTEGNAGTTTATFTVTLAGTSIQTVTVNYATADGTATTAGNDYVAASGTLTFAPGTITQTVGVTVNGDTVPEPNETFFVNLSGATNAVIGDSQGIGTITNDDTQIKGDFNGDGKTDILWRHQLSGDNLVWFMNGTTLTGGAVLTAISDTSWRIVGTADFNADGKTDILWRNQATGDNLVWLMNGTAIASGAVLTAVADTNWEIVGTEDFNADGKPDILWRHRVSGDNLVWFMNGTTVAGGAVLMAVGDTNWKVGGLGDFNADGKPDVLWRNQATGDNLVWLMNGTTVSSGVVLTAVADTNWIVGGVGDFNTDAKADILWRNQATGDNLVWLMNGTAIASGVVLPPIGDTNWRIVGPR